MPSETEIIISFLFKRSGKTQLSYSDLYLTLSMDLNWFAPDDAKAFIDLALKQKLLKKKGETIQPAFEYDKIIVPVGFTPSIRILGEEKSEKKDKKETDFFDKIVKHLLKETELKEEQVKEKIEKTSKEKNITREVAALLICREHGISVDFFQEVEESIFKESRE